MTAILAVAFAAAVQLSGLASEEALTLAAFAPNLDFRGLLLAAVVIGTLGVLDDVTITQVSAVWELRRSDPLMSARQLYAAGIRIGRDHIASTVNTLVLAYAAAALPLLLIYTQSGLGFGGVMTTETVAVEIAQTLVGSIGLVASVPLTTGLACLVVTRRPQAGERLGGWPEPGYAEPRYPDQRKPEVGDPWGPDPRADRERRWQPPRQPRHPAPGPAPAVATPARPTAPSQARPARRSRRDPENDGFWTNRPW